MKISAPDRGFTGKSHYGDHVIEFENGVATVDELPEPVRAYMEAAGYGFGNAAPAEREQPEVVDARDVTVQVVGTPLRDAAVDPRPEDYLPPTNAGEADPHGPLVVAPGIHAAGTQVVRPGEVHVGDAEAQGKAQTEQATALLVEGQDVHEATPTFVLDESDTGPLGLSDPGSVEQGKAAAKEAAADDRPAPAKKAAAKKTAAKKAASSR